jgi:hypothetical protein
MGMLDRRSLRVSLACVLLPMAVLGIVATEALANDPAKYPDWAGQWRISGGNRWDPTKPGGRGQQAPLTPEYQAIFEASLADQALGGPGNDPSTGCFPTGMPRLMTLTFALEFVVLPNITHMLFENRLPRRVFTDGRDWPKEIQPSFSGYSIGQWGKADQEGRYHELLIETRGFKGPRNFEPTGIPLHDDNQSVIKERIFLDPANPNILNNEITTIDNALTRPWTVTKKYNRDRERDWLEAYCNEHSQHVYIGKEAYYLSADGHLMPVKKGQPPPDLRYFPQAPK